MRRINVTASVILLIDAVSVSRVVFIVRIFVIFGLLFNDGVRCTHVCS